MTVPIHTQVDPNAKLVIGSVMFVRPVGKEHKAVQCPELEATHSAIKYIAILTQLTWLGAPFVQLRLDPRGLENRDDLF